MGIYPDPEDPVAFAAEWTAARGIDPPAPRRVTRSLPLRRQNAFLVEGSTTHEGRAHALRRAGVVDGMDTASAAHMLGEQFKRDHPGDDDEDEDDNGRRRSKRPKRNPAPAPARNSRPPPKAGPSRPRRRAA